MVRSNGGAGSFGERRRGIAGGKVRWNVHKNSLSA